jgi:hypothetical protein
MPGGSSYSAVAGRCVACGLVGEIGRGRGVSNAGGTSSFIPLTLRIPVRGATSSLFSGLGLENCRDMGSLTDSCVGVFSPESHCSRPWYPGVIGGGLSLRF